MEHKNKITDQSAHHDGRRVPSLQRAPSQQKYMSNNGHKEHEAEELLHEQRIKGAKKGSQTERKTMDRSKDR